MGASSSLTEDKKRNANKIIIKNLINIQKNKTNQIY